MPKLYLDDLGVVHYDPTPGNDQYRGYIRRKTMLLVLDRTEEVHRSEALLLAREGNDIDPQVAAIVQIRTLRRRILAA